MKKIIIMFMAISMLLVSCSTPNTSYDDEVIEVSTPTNNPSGDNENTDNGNDITNNTDVNYFELRSNETVHDYDYKVTYNNSPVNSKFRETRLDVKLLEGTLILDVSNDDNKIKFTSRDGHKSVQNVTVDRPTNRVTIKLVDNN